MKKIKNILLVLILIIPLSAAVAYPEGFVWRRSINEPLITRDLQEMCRVERVWSAFLRQDYKHKNISLARLGILYEFGGRQHYLSTWVSVPEMGRMTEKIPIFVSGSAVGIFDNLDGLQINNLHTLNTHLSFEEFAKDNFIIVDNSTIDTKKWYNELFSLYSIENSLPDKIIASALTAQRLADHRLSYQDFERLYAHSEQWLLYHLSKISVFRSTLEKLMQIVRPAKPFTIRKIVLLIHTNRDACQGCSQTIAVFTRHLKQVTESILGALPHDPLVIISSRTGYQERRSTVGHDGHAADIVDINDSSRVVKQVTLLDFPIHYEQLMLME